MSTLSNSNCINNRISVSDTCRCCKKVLKDANKANKKINNVIKVPELSQSLINDVEKYILSPFYRNISSNNEINNNSKLKLGVIKFLYNGKNYIHCPILNIDTNNRIQFGICPSFKSLENTFNNRQKLCAHKYRSHFKCNTVMSSNIHIKASQSIEDVLLNCNNNI